MEHNVIVVIPARGGSQRIPKKNTVERLLCGKPLIEYTIDCLKGSILKDAPTVISTEHAATLDWAVSKGCYARRRPAALCGADVTPADVVIDSVEWMGDQGFPCDIVVLPQITSPLREPKDIDLSMELFLVSGGKRLVSVSEVQEFPYDMIDSNGNFLRVDKQKLLYLNGAVYISYYDIVKNNKVFYANDGQTVFYQMPKYRSIDVDDMEDLEVAEKIMRGIQSNG